MFPETNYIHASITRFPIQEIIPNVPIVNDNLNIPMLDRRRFFGSVIHVHYPFTGQMHAITRYCRSVGYVVQAADEPSQFS